MLKRFCPVSLVTLLVAASVPAGDAPDLNGTQADYERAAKLRSILRNTVFKTRVTPNWSSDGTRFWYRNDLADKAREFIVVDATTGKREPAFDHAKVAENLSKLLNKDVNPTHLPVDRIAFSEKKDSVDLWIGGAWWCCNLKSYELRKLKAGERKEPSLKTLPRPRPSQGKGGETHIHFHNKTAGEVKLEWVDFRGARKGYGKIAPGAKRSQHTFAGHVWAAVAKDGRVLASFEATADPGLAIITKQTPKEKAKPDKPKPSKPKKVKGTPSPDGKWTAYLRDHNVILQDLKSDTEVALTKDGSEKDRYEGKLLWSADSRRLVAMRAKPGQTHKVHAVESSPKDQVQPKLHTWNYLKPGDRITHRRPCLFDVPAKQQMELSEKLFENPWRISELRMDSDGKRFTFLYNQRGHQVMRVVAVDLETGSVSALIDETPKTFFNYSSKLFYRPLDKTAEILWMSERDGWNHLYLYDAKTGKVKNRITRGEWLVRAVDRVDEEKRQIWFHALGIHPEQDPYHVHYARVNFDGSGLTVLTDGNGTHNIAFSPDGRFLVDTWSRVDQPPVTELRRTSDGKQVCELERADISALQATGWRPPERFVAKGRDGKTDIYGIIHRPYRYDPKRTYPVIEAIYAGPHGHFVPKSFGTFRGQQRLAELGFIVVQIDGMGTNWRSKAFHDVCWKNIGDAGIPDRVLWIKAAAAKYAEMDATRVGIYGGSAGGQSALGTLLTHGDFYKAAAADCGCHDNRMDKIWWNEAWMGWPIGPHYAAQSNVTLAHKLKGKLLLTVGELDRNVDPASTMQVVNALIKADKDFEFVLIPGAGHGCGESPYGRRRRADFFVRNLLGVEPRRK